MCHAIGYTLLAVVATVVVRTWQAGQRPIPAAPLDANAALDRAHVATSFAGRADAIAERLATAVRFQTVSFDDTRGNDGDSSADSALRGSDQFLGLHRFLEATYPLMHAKLTRTVVEKYR